MSDRQSESRSIERSNGDQVERLVRLAGRRPAVPADHAAAVKAAARTEWQRTVRARRRRRLVTRGAGALMAAAALVLLAVGTDIWRPVPPAPPAALAVLEAATGPVTAAGRDLVPGHGVAAGALLETAAGGASPVRAALRLAGGASVRLDTGTRLGLISDSRLELHRGAVYVDSGALAQRLEIHTPFGIARNVGTRFEVRLGSGDEPPQRLQVRVRGGEVVLERDGEEHAAAAGVELAVLADGTVEERQVTAHGPAWDWVLAVLPPFEIRGRPLRDVLEWAVNEGGWTLRFADQAAAARMGSTVEAGSAAGLTVEEALSLVLPGFGLNHRLEDGVLVVASAG